MARPVSWLQQIPRIKRTLNQTQQSDFGRTDLQDLFDLRERAAAELMELLPRTMLWGSFAVKREELLRFLDEVLEAEDVPGLFARRRAEHKNPLRKRPRQLIRRDTGVADAAALGPWLTRGRMEIRFDTAQQLFDALWRVAMAMQEDFDAFIALYEPRPLQAHHLEEQGDVRRMFEELEQMERTHG